MSRILRWLAVEEESRTQPPTRNTLGNLARSSRLPRPSPRPASMRLSSRATGWRTRLISGVAFYRVILFRARRVFGTKRRGAQPGRGDDRSVDPWENLRWPEVSPQGLQCRAPRRPHESVPTITVHRARCNGRPPPERPVTFHADAVDAPDRVVSLHPSLEPQRSRASDLVSGPFDKVRGAPDLRKNRVRERSVRSKKSMIRREQRHG